MVRETRHLWVGNLPDNIREDRIREHFKRYGRVQNVKLLGRTESVPTGASVSGNSGVCATVAFMDIKSASKAHNIEHVLDERTLTTEYYEPAAIPSSAGAPSAGSSPAGSGYSGSSSSVNSIPVPASVSRYHITGVEESPATTTCPLAASVAAPATWRGTNDSATEFCRRGSTPAAYGRYQRNNSTAPYSTPPSTVERTTSHHRWYGSGEKVAGATGGESTPSTPGAGTESGRRRRRSGSGSSNSDSSSPDASDTSRASTPATQPNSTHHTNHRASQQHQWAATANGRPLAICVRNLPTRSTDSSLKDGLYHEYKKHGKVVWVKVVGQNADRYAVVRFKKPSDVEKALEVSQDKLFFGCKISVAPHQSCEEDAESAKPYETDIDEYHPKATRTLFIGNLEKDVTQQLLREKFKHFGRIIEIDIKKGSGGGAGYAFCQYASISSVVEAIRAMDGEYVGGSRVKLGFGKPVATTCVWVDGLTEHTEKQVLGAVSRCGAATSVCVDRAAGAALVHFEQAAAAGAAVRELRRVAATISAAEPEQPRLCVDYASRECQEAFYEQLEKHGGTAALAGSERLAGEIGTRYLPTARHEPTRYDSCGSRSRASSYGRSSSRTPRYSVLDHYDPTDYAADRRYRVHDDITSSPQNEDVPYEERLQSVVVSPHRARKHRRDSSPEERKHSKERHRSRRSRSGSRSVGTSTWSGRRRHRRKHEGSGSRAGTPLRDEPEALPCEPRRGPRERPPLPMSLPLPKFAEQLLRTCPPTPRPQSAPAPDSPPRPPSASSSSGPSAPHSPSLEERIRSLDEKYEKWSGSRALADAPDRARFRHRLLEVDINEVKPSEVVRSLLAKRSVFDEDTERLESVVRAPSPMESPRARPQCVTPRTLRYPFPTHGLHSTNPPHLSVTSHIPLPSLPSPTEVEIDGERPIDPRLARSSDRLVRPERLNKINENEYKMDMRHRPMTPPIDKLPLDLIEHIPPEETSMCLDKRLSFSTPGRSDDNKSSELFIADKAISGIGLECKTRLDYFDHDKTAKRKDSIEKESFSLCANVDISDIKLPDDPPPSTFSEDNTARDVMDMILKQIEQHQESQILKFLETSSEKLFKSNYQRAEDRSIVKFNSKDNNITCQSTNDSEKNTEILIPNHTSKEITDELQKKLSQCDGFSKILFDRTSKEKNVLQEKSIEKEKCISNSKPQTYCEKKVAYEKSFDDRGKSERDKTKTPRERLEKDKSEHEKSKNHRQEKHDKDKKSKDGLLDKTSSDKLERKVEKDHEKQKEKKEDATAEKHLKPSEEKSKHDHQKREKSEKERRKDSTDECLFKIKRDDRHRHDKSKKDDSKRDFKKDSESKSRKSSRDETTREISRKDSTDSSTSRASHESSKHKDAEINDIKEESKSKSKNNDHNTTKHDQDKDSSLKPCENKHDVPVKVKTEEKDHHRHSSDHQSKTKSDHSVDIPKCKTEYNDKQRHYSVDSPSLDTKKKERLNSCSSLPSNIGNKRRMSSQDSLDSLHDDIKKIRNDLKHPERRDSKDTKGDKHKTTKFSKGHYAKIIEGKTKDEKRNQVKLIDDYGSDHKENETKSNKSDRLKPYKKSPKDENDKCSDNHKPDGLQNDLDFLATLQLRSSEEDEKQKALRREMKEKKRLQQLQQIQELQMQQDALQHCELMIKLKDDKKLKSEDKKKDMREKRMSIDRKSREEKYDNRRKNRKNLQTSDSSDSDDEPKKHSIFDIVDDGPTYISMYDKVKARSCKNMQKQEEEKRQEKIKAKFSQLKQSRAKREEKKRSSWDEDSDSDLERKRHHKSSIDNSTDDDSTFSKKHTKLDLSDFINDIQKTEDFSGDSICESHLSNKLSRKNSRTRIISDSSDDDKSNRSISKSPIFRNNVKKEFVSDSDSLSTYRNDFDVHDQFDKEKKNTLLNLFGKSDSDDSKIKNVSEGDSNFKSSVMKSLCIDFSSENESIDRLPNRNFTEIRRKHKKKQRKHKIEHSDGEPKNDKNDSVINEREVSARYNDKIRRHSTKKEKRREKTRESIDIDEFHDDKQKTKKEKKILSSNCNSFEGGVETINLKKEGKMEDIFGPLTDESDKEINVHQVSKTDFTAQECSTFGKTEENDTTFINIDLKNSEKDEIKRRRDKKRNREKHIVKEDENSLDVDAVSKAIEARLFADSTADEENRAKPEKYHGIHNDSVDETTSPYKDISERHEKNKRDYRDKKKKKKRYKDERTSRRDVFLSHETKNDKLEKSDVIEVGTADLPSKTKTIEETLPTEVSSNKFENNSPTESQSLPLLTDSPPNNLKADIGEAKSNNSNIDDNKTEDKDLEEMVCVGEVNTEVTVTEENFKNTVEDISLVHEQNVSSPPDAKKDIFQTTYNSDASDAVRSISNLENETEKASEICTDLNDRLCQKVDEKPRAIISQEETEDAVAALLGESFGGKEDSFTDCYEATENVTIQKNEIGPEIIVSESIPEEDAEEMRQAVQNLNASELESKPDTPVSDNDLLLIDTDNEEVEDSTQDAIERLPVNIIATSQALNVTVEQLKQDEVSKTTITSKIESVSEIKNDPKKSVTVKISESDLKVPIPKKDCTQVMTSTATPVITSWALSNNKLIESPVINIKTNPLINREKTESKPTHITANIVQIKASSSQNIQVTNSLRPIITPARIGAPYQVINQIIRPQVSNIQPPTIKIPESHILYQKPQGIVISPRMSCDSLVQNTKNSQQAENAPTPRIANMAILSTTPTLNSAGITTTCALQQRSPGQVTVVRMQQPPLSPIQTMHIQHGPRAIVSPNRHNSVLVQAPGPNMPFNRQTTPIHVTPVLTPINKQVNVNNLIQHNKGLGVSSPLLNSIKTMPGECKKLEQNATESIKESPKIILSPNNLQHNSNPTIMAQNRLISMQNSMHMGNLNTTLHLNNKVLINTISQLHEKRENQSASPEQLGHISFGGTPIIHVAGVSHSTASIIQSNVKPVMCSIQDSSAMNRGPGSNVIHAVSSQRLMTPLPLSNVRQLEANKGPSVLSMASVKSPTVLTKVDSSSSSNTFSKISPILIKATSPESLHSEIKIENNDDISKPSDKSNENKIEQSELLQNDCFAKAINEVVGITESKCGTDFEELLKDNTNEIKVMNDPEKKLEINVGKTITVLSTSLSSADKLRTENNENVDLTLNCAENNDEKPTVEYSLQKLIKDKIVPDVDNVFSPRNETNPTQFVPEETENTERECKSNISNFQNINTNKDMKSEKIESHAFQTQELPGIEDDNEIKTPDEIDSWSAKDVNIESVIKKVDSLCKENNENEVKVDTLIKNENTVQCDGKAELEENLSDSSFQKMTTETPNKLTLSENSHESLVDKSPSSNRRGGRSLRGKRSDKKQDRVQNRNITKPMRGVTTKRGRGRGKVDKNIKDLVKNSTCSMPGDVYDFHEDSGDESTTAPAKVESRPRLILTIKSPLSGHCNMIATSTLSISQKDQSKCAEKTNKEEKLEDFISPSLNTRKSRRLQEKDVQRGTADDIDDILKTDNIQTKNSKKRSTRQNAVKVNLDKNSNSDVRKSPRGTKRVRDRSLSDASIESGDEKHNRKEDHSSDAKIPRSQGINSADEVAQRQILNLEQNTAIPSTVGCSVSTPKLALATVTTVPPTTLPVISAAAPKSGSNVATVHPTVPTPITKPPKKMISERSAKLAIVFETQQETERGGEVQGARVPAVLVPIGGTEATGEVRVQSPALPHRGPDPPAPAPLRPADRATPVLISTHRSSESGHRAYMPTATASLPRGAHHPPPDPPLLHKQLAVVNPHHHTGAGSRVTITSVPSISPQGQIGMGESMYPHYSHQHYQMYQQHFRATQHENRASPSPFTRTLETEGCETPTPPLELRRPRAPRPAHSPAPADRLIIYGGARSPPPAHGRPLAAPPGPPHASQVPREADSLQMLLRRYPVMWQGLLALKNDSAAVQMHFVGGNPGVAGDTLSRHHEQATPLLRIAQRMRLEPAQLDQVHRKMKMENEHCMLLALPCGRDHMDVLQQSNNLTAGFITYLQRKQAAGIVNIAPPGHHQAMFTVHIFPSCDFANENLNRIAPDLMHRVADIAHLLIVIATV